MATIHQTSMTPSKLELLASWLPTQDWYVGPEAPELRRAGGFRLDDPAGEVGIEFVIVNAIGGSAAVTYHVPMTYRGAPLPEAESALIGTADHGVLGPRWVYDGTADPVLLAQLTKLLCGLTLAQHQSRSDEVDEDVVVRTTTDRDAANGARILRVLEPQVRNEDPGVTTTWEAPDGTGVTGPVVTAVS